MLLTKKFSFNKVGSSQFFSLNSLREVGDHILPMLNNATFGTFIFQNICHFIKKCLSQSSCFQLYLKHSHFL